jgi:hypothetical protein
MIFYKHYKQALMKLNSRFKNGQMHISGYAKMDKLASTKLKLNTKKQILLCPHHTVHNKDLEPSNFLQYLDLFLELPKLYPDVDFIFRPHQLLKYNLINYWGDEKTNKYYETIISYPNVVYDNN